MKNVLRFWRDVEIFNIPDAPTASKPGRPGHTALPDEAAADEGSESGPDLRPRTSVVQRFKVPMPGARTLPLLPWHDPRFQVLDEAAAAPHAAPDHHAEDDAPPPPASYAHAVYLGVAPKQRFVDFILRTHAIDPTEDERYRPATGRGWLAAFIAGGTGGPLRRTYVAASFAVGSSLLQQQRSLDEASATLELRSAAFDERMAERRQDLEHENPAATLSLDWEHLRAEWAQVHQPLGGTGALDRDGALGPEIVIESVPLYRRKDGSLNPAPEQAAAFLNSFYIDDLTTLIQGAGGTIGAALDQYLGPDSDAASRVDLLADPAVLARHAAAALIPPGRWVAPPAEHLALAQQAAVYQILERIGRADGDRSRGLMAVNGPPGTGKTTLLKDIVADVVVQRAKRLCALQQPEDLFSGRAINVGSGADAPAIRADLMAGTEIVVTSSNNAAVQNISFELPFACDRTSFPHAAYFPEVAAFIGEKFRLARKNPWGLLSVALGAKPNREKIATALMGYEIAVKAGEPDTHPVAGKAASLKPWLDQVRQQGYAGDGGAARRRWLAAKEDFAQRLAQVEARRARLALVDAAIGELPAIAARRDTLERQRASLADSLAALHAARHASQAARLDADARDQAAAQAVQRQIAAGQAEHAVLLDALHEPGWLARGLKKMLGIETAALRHWKSELGKARAALDLQRARLNTLERERGRLDAGCAQRAREAAQDDARHAAAVQAHGAEAAAVGGALAALAEREAALRASLALLEQPDPPCVPDAAFLALAPGEKHSRSLWLDQDLEQARADLFLAALRLHEATIMATAGAWFKVLRVVRDFLRGQAEPRTREDRAALWHSLFFVVPVVSTTLASFGRLFDGLERESLGWVMIDEAGQATPASVAGALWRARRAILVGDPLQIEPVVTVPRRLVESLGRKRGLDDPAVARWSPSRHSAQSLADRTMALGANVGDVWTGMPLRTHRRCMRPMFEIANKIAYDLQMVQATRPREIAPDLFASCWIDVGGEAAGKVVDEQIKALGHIMASFLLAWPQVIDDAGGKKPASVYVISPFRDVANACKDMVGADSPLGRTFAAKKLLVDAGTVHTFQGKEAAIVFLVLGSAPGEAGAGSRNWAAGKPNLLNVAVTRAQQRFYVIGNYADWSGLPYFSEMAEAGGHMRRTRLGMADGSAQVWLAPMPAA